MKTLPAMAKSMAEGVKEAAGLTSKSMDGLKAEMSGMREDMNEHQSTLISMLRENISRK